MTDVDPKLCHKYASFAAGLDRVHFKTLYFTLFITNLIVLFFGSWVYIKGQQAMERLGKDSWQRARALRTYIFVCAACVAVSTVIVVMEAYALLALQFCDGEDLMSLYWATFTMIQIGSLIAIVGIILALGHSLRNREHPPWALALGTPVLVIAGILHLVHDCTKKRVKKLKRMSKDALEDGHSPPISQTNSSGSSQMGDKCNDLEADLIGFTVDGGPIVKFTQPVSDMSRGELMGYDRRGNPTYSFPRGVVRFESSNS